jgi:hypothetical protein
MDTRTMTEMTEEQIRDLVKQIIREELRVESKTDSVYNGGMDGTGNMYTNYHSVQLILDGEVISETSLS